MKLVWHLARTDLRRLRPALVAWLTFVVAKATLVLLMLPAPSLADASAHFASLVHVLNSFEAFGAVVIALWLGQEDPATGVRAWWPTRPVAGGRLLAAKLCALGLGLVALPALLLTPVWLAAGLPVSDAACCAVDDALLHALLALVGLTAAAVSGSLSQGLGVLAGAAVGWGVVALVRGVGGRPALLLVALLGLVGMGAMAVAYAGRRRGAAVSVLAGGLLLVAALGWPVSGDGGAGGTDRFVISPVEAGRHAGPWRIAAVTKEGGRTSIWVRCHAPQSRWVGAGWEALERGRVMFVPTGAADAEAIVHARRVTAFTVASVGVGCWRVTLAEDVGPAGATLVCEPGVILATKRQPTEASLP